MEQLPRVRVVPETASTQDDVLAAVRDDTPGWPHLAALRAERQTAGRGRAGRGWDTGRTVALTASVVLRPHVEVARWPWLPLLAGLAVVRALAVPGAGLKWPNDVVVPEVGADGAEGAGGADGADGADRDVDGWGTWRKVAGVLADVVPARDGGPPTAVVVGIGVNLDGDAPVPWASTLRAHGVAVDGAALLDRVRGELGALLQPGAENGWRAEVAARCVSIGAGVRVLGVDGTEMTGSAVGLDDDGALLVREGGAGSEHRVLAGDVRHLRTASGAG